GIKSGMVNCCPERTALTMNGIAWVNSKVTMVSISDGTSNTFLFMEAAHYTNQSWYPPEKGSNPFFFVHHASEGYVGSREGSAVYPVNSTQNNTRAARGPHTGGITVSWADGHVGFISNNIDFATYDAMFSRNGGDVLKSFA